MKISGNSVRRVCLSEFTPRCAAVLHTQWESISSSFLEPPHYLVFIILFNASVSLYIDRQRCYVYIVYYIISYLLDVLLRISDNR
jgi:hypothetical protein